MSEGCLIGGAILRRKVNGQEAGHSLRMLITNVERISFIELALLNRLIDEALHKESGISDESR